MWSATFGIIPNISQTINSDISLDIFRRMCISRYLELGLVNASKKTSSIT